MTRWIDRLRVGGISLVTLLPALGVVSAGASGPAVFFVALIAGLACGLALLASRLL